jgi:hypothetical protein
MPVITPMVTSYEYGISTLSVPFLSVSSLQTCGGGGVGGGGHQGLGQWHILRSRNLKYWKLCAKMRHGVAR